MLGLTGLGLSFGWTPDRHSQSEDAALAAQTGNRYLVQAAMLEGDHPRSIEVGEEKLLYWPEVHYENDWISADYRFYRLVEGELFRVTVQDSE